VFIGHSLYILMRVLGVKIFGGDFLGRLAFESCKAVGVDGGHMDKVMWGWCGEIENLRDRSRLAGLARRQESLDTVLWGSFST